MIFVKKSIFSVFDWDLFFAFAVKFKIDSLGALREETFVERSDELSLGDGL